MACKRTILITGCSDGGLGSHLALAFHKAGWRVFASARNLAKLKLVQAAGIETIQLDTVSDESIASAVTRVAELTGDASLDALLNNAGGGYSMPLLDLDLDKTRKLFDLNVFSLITMSRSFLPLLMKSKHGGMIFNNTSCSSQTAGALPFAGAYNSSKAAATSITEVLRLELAPFGIKVINIMTGAVTSAFHDNAPHDKLPPSSLYNVAKEVVENTMGGGEAAQDKADPVKWSEGVANALSKSKPPHWLWCGKMSTVVRLGSLLPIGFLDGTIRKMTGLDVVERKVREQGGPGKIKFA